MARTDRKISVAQLTYSLGQGGVERGIVHLVNRLPADQFRQIVISLTEPTDLAGEITNREAKLYRLQKRAGNDPLIVPQLRRILLSEAIDILHGRGWAMLVEGLLAARLTHGCRFVYGYHGKTYEDAVHPKRRRILAQRILLPWADALVAVAPSVARTWCQEVGLATQRVTVICDGVPTTPPVDEAERVGIRRELAIPDRHWVIGSVGRIDPVKDYPTMLKAFALLRREGVQALLVLVGDGPHRLPLQQEARALGVEGAVRFLGKRQDVPRLLSIFDVFVQASLSEAMPNALLEAMGAGVPVVATSVGGTLDVVTDGVNGCLFPPGEAEALAAAISNFLQNEDRRRALATEGRAEVLSRYTVEAMVAGYAALYERLAGRDAQEPSGTQPDWPFPSRMP